MNKQTKWVILKKIRLINQYIIDKWINEIIQENKEKQNEKLENKKRI